jgi:hypothetical protein
MAGAGVTQCAAYLGAEKVAIEADFSLSNEAVNI